MRNFSVTGRLVLALVLIGALGAVAVLLQAQPTTSPVSTSKPGLANGEPERELDSPGLAGSEKNESQELFNIEQYWHNRVTYPTGQFDGRWLLNAANQDKAIAQGVPAGRVIYNRANNASPLSLDPAQWTALGPQPLQSNGCTGCYQYGHVSGRVNWMMVDPVTPNVAYLASVGGGIWKSTNCCSAATSWTPTMDDPLITTVSIDHMSFDPANHNTIYAATGDMNYGSFSMGSAGVLKSTDAGATWTLKGADVFGPYYPQPPNIFPQYQAIDKVEVDPRNSNIVIAGAKTGLYLSYNAGDTWAGPCLPDAYPTQRQDIKGLILRDNGTSTDMYVAVGTRGFSTTVQYSLAENGANGIYKSTVPAASCPANWTLVSRPDNGWPVGTGSGIPVYQAGGNPLGRIDMAMAPSAPDTLYVIVQDILGTRSAPLGVWRTTNGGTSWTQQTTMAGFGGCDGPGAQSWYNQNIIVDPNNPDLVYAQAIDLFRSTNGGTSFTNTTCGYAGGNTVHVDHHALAYAPGSSTVLLVGSDGGAYVTLNANAATPTFSQLNDSLNTIEFYGGDITANFANSSSPGVNAGAQDNGSPVYVWSGTPGPAMWQLRKGGDGMFARIEPVLAQRWYQESQNGALAATSAGPYGGQTSATGGWTADTRRSFVFPYEIYKGTPANPATDCAATGCTHLIAGSYRIWETILGGVPGSTWYINSGDLTKNTLADRSFINQLSYAPSISTTAIVGTNDGNVQFGFNLGTGVPNTATWVNVTDSNNLLPNRPILDVAIDPVNPLIGYAAVGGFNENTPSTPGHVFRVDCTANCASFTWSNKTGNLPNIPVDSVIANPLFPQQVFLGTDWGFYYTDNINANPPTWARFQANLPNVMIWDMSIDRGSTTLALFTRSRGAYVWPLPAGPIGGTATPVVATPTASVVPPTQTMTVVPPTITIVPPTITVVPPTITVVPPTITVVPVTGTPGQVTMTATPGQTTMTPTVGATTTPCTISFTDVPPSQPFYIYIRCLACRGIISGYADGSFQPGNPVTRGQAVKMIANAAGIFDPVPSTQQTFVDVPNNHPFWVYIERLAGRGYISGYADNTFRPQNTITRGQFAKVDANAAQYNDPIPSNQQTFADVPTSDPFWLFVERVAAHGIISGYTCDPMNYNPCSGQAEECDSFNRPYFRTCASTTRGQGSKIVANTFFPGCTTP